MASIEELIGDRIVEILTQVLITDLPGNDPKRATLIRQGLRQSDPTKNRIAAFVHPFDPSNQESSPRWSDVPGGSADNAWNVQERFIGGGGYQWRRWLIEFDIYLTRTQEDRDDARSIAHWVVSRAEKALRDNEAITTSGGGALADEFGESAHVMYVRKTTRSEAGGPPKSFIWEAKIFVEVLTETD